MKRKAQFDLERDTLERDGNDYKEDLQGSLNENVGRIQTPQQIAERRFLKIKGLKPPNHNENNSAPKSVFHLTKPLETNVPAEPQRKEFSFLNPNKPAEIVQTFKQQTSLLFDHSKLQDGSLFNNSNAKPKEIITPFVHNEKTHEISLFGQKIENSFSNVIKNENPMNDTKPVENIVNEKPVENIANEIKTQIQPVENIVIDLNSSNENNSFNKSPPLKSQDLFQKSNENLENKPQDQKVCLFSEKKTEIQEEKKVEKKTEEKISSEETGKLESEHLQTTVESKKLFGFKTQENALSFSDPSNSTNIATPNPQSSFLFGNNISTQNQSIFQQPSINANPFVQPASSIFSAPTKKTNLTSSNLFVGSAPKNGGLFGNLLQQKPNDTSTLPFLANIKKGDDNDDEENSDGGDEDKSEPGSPEIDHTKSSGSFKYEEMSDKICTKKILKFKHNEKDAYESGTLCIEKLKDKESYIVVYRNQAKLIQYRGWLLKKFSLTGSINKRADSLSLMLFTDKSVKETCKIMFVSPNECEEFKKEIEKIVNQ